MKISKSSLLGIVLPLLAIGIGVIVAVTYTNSNQIETVDQESSLLVSYDDYRANLASYENDRVVYFFHARWCGTCRALEGSLTNNSGQLPADLTFVKVDFDTEDELKEKYGVRVQHTLVQVKNDPDNTIVGKWVGQPNVQAVLEDIQEV